MKRIERIAAIGVMVWLVAGGVVVVTSGAIQEIVKARDYGFLFLQSTLCLGVAGISILLAWALWTHEGRK